MKIMAHQAKEPRSQDLDNFFSKIKDLNDASPSLKKKLQNEVIKQYHDKMIKKSNQEKEYNNKLLRWKQDQKRKDSKKVSKINGQKFVDMSAGTCSSDDFLIGVNNWEYIIFDQQCYNTTLFNPNIRGLHDVVSVCDCAHAF